MAGRHSTGEVRTIAIELRVVVGKLVRRLRGEAQAAGDLTESQRVLLLRLERDGPATITALARAEGVRPQSLGATAAVLEAARLIASAPDPSDGRQFIWSLTPACRQLLKNNRAAKEDWLLHAISCTLTPAEQGTLAAAIRLLDRVAEAASA